MDSKSQWYFFAGICTLIVVLSFFVFQPFLPSLALGIFLSLLFRPVYSYLLVWWPQRERLIAFGVVILALFIIIGPLLLLGSQLFREAQSVYGDLLDTNLNPVERSLEAVENVVRTMIPGFSLNLSTYLQSALNWAQENGGSFVFGTIEGIFLTLLVIFLFYYFLYHGEKIKDQIINLSPLPDSYDVKVAEAIKNTVDSVLRGTLLIALIQGILVGFGLLIFGLPHPVLLGSIAAFSAFIPGIGTGIILIPAVAFLFFEGDLYRALGLAIWGVVVVGLVDNFLIPFFYGKSIRVHPVFVLLSVLGGLSFFGFLGFIFGPILLSLLVVLLDIYRLATSQKSTSRDRL